MEVRVQTQGAWVCLSLLNEGDGCDGDAMTGKEEDGTAVMMAFLVGGDGLKR